MSLFTHQAVIRALNRDLRNLRCQAQWFLKANQVSNWSREQLWGHLTEIAKEGLIQRHNSPFHTLGEKIRMLYCISKLDKEGNRQNTHSPKPGGLPQIP